MPGEDSSSGKCPKVFRMVDLAKMDEYFEVPVEIAAIQYDSMPISSKLYELLVQSPLALQHVPLLTFRALCAGYSLQRSSDVHLQTSDISQEALEAFGITARIFAPERWLYAHSEPCIASYCDSHSNRGAFFWSFASGMSREELDNLMAKMMMACSDLEAVYACLGPQGIEAGRCISWASEESFRLDWSVCMHTTDSMDRLKDPGLRRDWLENRRALWQLYGLDMEPLAEFIEEEYG